MDLGAKGSGSTSADAGCESPEIVFVRTVGPVIDRPYSKTRVLLPARCRLGQVLLRLRLTLQWRYLVRIEADHQVIDVIVDLGEQMARTRRNHNDVSRFQVVSHAVTYLRPIVSGSIVLDNRSQGCRTPLSIRDVRSKDQRGRSGNDVIDLADLVMFGDRVRCRFV